MSISAKQVTKTYGTQKALNRVSFEIGTGEIVGFLGPNGAGKSTMMKIITCFIPQTEGEVKVCGFSVNENPIEVKKRVGYLPENNPLYYDMYVKEYLAFIAGLHKLQNVEARVTEMIEMVGLTIEQHKKIGQLSKGYKQRVGLAQALIHDPEVLILDEPTTGLDPNQIVEIRNLIQEIGKEKTVLMSTHIMQEVEAICDRVIIINKGKIAADESASEVKNLLKDQIVVVVEFAETITEEKLKAVQGVDAVQTIGKNRWQVKPQAGIDVREKIFKAAVENGWNIVSLNQEEKRLEEVFKTLTAN